MLTLGDDPEMFLYDHESCRIVNALTVLRKDKHDPVVLDGDIKMYADNVLVEFSHRPSYTSQSATVKIREALVACHERLGTRYSLLPICCHTFSDLPPKPSDELVKAWLEDRTGAVKGVPLEWQIGCNPNFDVYASEYGSPRNQLPFSSGLRTGSFHIHIGNANMEDPNEDRLLTAESKAKAVKLMDLFVGLSEVVFNDDESSHTRRKLYGRAGEFRPTNYGIEYRVLGNYALRSPRLTQLVYELTEYAMSMFDTEIFVDECLSMHDMDKVQSAINDNDKSLAMGILQESWLPVKLFDRVKRGHRATASGALKEWGI